MFADELKLSKFSMLKPIDRENGNWSCKIVYNGEPLHIQTPELTVTFDLNEYIYDNNNTNKLEGWQAKKKFSLTCSLNPQVNCVKGFQKIIEFVDNNTQKSYPAKTKNLQFCPALKHDPNGKYLTSMRFKLVNNLERFKCRILENGKPINDSIENVRKKLKKGTRVKLICQLNPIWKVGKKFGVSYQILGIDIQSIEVNFRKEFTDLSELKEE